jgi:RimK family alpha-L-glutamate ligase
VNVLILSARSGWHTDELCRALAVRGFTGRVMPYERLVARIGSTVGALHVAPAEPPGESGPDSGETSVFDADAVLARIIPDGSLEQIIYRVDALHWIEDRGIPVMNPARAIERAVDKFYTTALLQEAGLPTPETVVCETAAEAMAAIAAMLRDGAEVIIKPLFGSMGHGLVRLGDTELAWRVVRTLTQMKSVLYVQRAIDHGGRDVRAFVVGSRVLAAIERSAPPDEWRTNVAVGGSARPIELPAVWEQVAIRAARAVGAEYAGVDLIQSRAGELFVLEVNAIPGWQGLQRATGVDVAAAIVDHLADRVAARRGVAGVAGAP